MRVLCNSGAPSTLRGIFWRLGFPKSIWVKFLQSLVTSGSCQSCPQAKILEHDDVSYLKKILGELAMVLDQIEAELEKRKLENEGGCQLWGRWVLETTWPTPPCSVPAPLSQRSQRTSKVVRTMGHGVRQT